MVSVPRLCPGGTVACLASGPSLTLEDVNAVRDQVDAVIAINSTYQLAPWATALYAADDKWWHWHQGATEFAGLKYSLDRLAVRWPDVQVLRQAGSHGLELDPTGLCRGLNSGYQAINLAVHFGARRILLLGYDMQIGPNGQRHWHPDYPHFSPSPYHEFVKAFFTLVEPLRHIGVEVINCSRATALTAFPRMTIEDALLRCEVAA